MFFVKINTETNRIALYFMFTHREHDQKHSAKYSIMFYATQQLHDLTKSDQIYSTPH